MSERPGIADRIATQVADGVPVDWEAAFREVTDARERDLITSLRMLESVARVHGLPITPLSTTWAHLEVRGKLGEGGFAEVYRAWDPRLDREVALKLLKAEPSAGTGAAARVIEEGRLLARLRHTNVVTVFGAEVHGGRVGLWMELVRGRSLEQVLSDHGPLGPREAASIGIDLCRALSAVHRAGVVHRDVKAQNAMREEGGRIVLMDLGAGVDVAGAHDARDAAISGTPLYMAPELFRGEPATARSDIYSLGVLLYRLVTGAFPIDAASWSELRGRHARREAALLRDRRSDLPEAFVKVIERATAWDPQERFATAGAMEQALSSALGVESAPAGAIDPVSSVEPRGRSDRGLPISVRRIAGFGAAAVVVAGLVVTLFMITSKRGAVLTVKADLYRVAAGAQKPEPLATGSRLALGDRLNLELEASRPVHVYVIDEDERGHSYALFPMPGLDEQNPLPPGTRHVLPGRRKGKALSWEVNSPGGREHLIVLASTTRLEKFEAAMEGLAQPGQTAVPIPESAMTHLRGIGGIAAAPAATAGQSAAPLFELAQRLAWRAEAGKEVWLKQIELENPTPN